jgi:hypothetical protein
MRQERVNVLECGHVSDPHLSTLLALAEALGCTLDDLAAGHPGKGKKG